MLEEVCGFGDVLASEHGVLVVGIFGHLPDDSEVTDCQVELDTIFRGFIIDNFFKDLNGLSIVLDIFVANSKIIVGI